MENLKVHLRWRSVGRKNASNSNNVYTIDILALYLPCCVLVSPSTTLALYLAHLVPVLSISTIAV
jgi:hypothetical protein